MRSKRAIIAILLVLWLISLSWVVYQWMYPAQLLDVAPYEEIALEPLEIAQVNASIAGLPNYDGLLERPLFYPGRRPPEPEIEPEVAPPPPPPPPADERLTLIGVVLMPEGMRALIKEEDSRRVRRLGPGDSVSSWRLEEVAAQQVRLTQGERNRILILERNRRQAALERTPVPEASSETSPVRLEQLPEEPATDATPENQLEEPTS